MRENYYGGMKMRIEKLLKKIIVIVVSLAVINSTVTSSVALSALGLYNLYNTEDTTNVTVDDTNQTEEIANENTLQTQPGGGYSISK